MNLQATGVAPILSVEDLKHLSVFETFRDWGAPLTINQLTILTGGESGGLDYLWGLGVVVDTPDDHVDTIDEDHFTLGAADDEHVQYFQALSDLNRLSAIIRERLPEEKQTAPNPSGETWKRKRAAFLASRPAQDARGHKAQQDWFDIHQGARIKLVRKTNPHHRLYKGDHTRRWYAWEIMEPLDGQLVLDVVAALHERFPHTDNIAPHYYLQGAVQRKHIKLVDYPKGK